MRINGYSWLLGFTRFTPVLCEAASSTGGPQNTSKKSRKFSNRKLRKCQTFTRQKANTGRLVYGLHVFHTFLTYKNSKQLQEISVLISPVGNGCQPMSTARQLSLQQLLAEENTGNTSGHAEMGKTLKTVQDPLCKKKEAKKP